MNLPEGYQPVYIAYPGDGREYYFTAVSDEEAKVYIKANYPLIMSAFRLGVIIKAVGNYSLRNGVSGTASFTNILND